MIDAKYSYLIFASAFILPWFFIFVRRKDLRQEMLLASIIGVLIAPPFQYFWYTVDWWQPITITGTRVGIEDLILGFTNVGIAAAFYEMTFHKSVKRIDRSVISGKFLFRLIKMLIISIGVMIIATNFLGIHSFYGNIIGLATGSIYMLVKRRDLLHESVWTAILMTALTFPAYWLALVTNPSWVEQAWLPHIFTEVKLIYVPIGDIIWYAASGFFTGGLFEYLTGQKLVSKRRHNIA